MAYGLEIASTKLNLRLGMIEIDALKPHEEVIENVVDQLAREIENDRIVRDPLIVDQKALIILDGMHRFNALKRLHCRFAPCCLLDYTNPHISVGSWFRWFQMEDPKTTAESALSAMRLNYTLKQVDVAEIDLAGDAIIVTQNRDCFSLGGSPGALERCRIAVGIEKRLVSEGNQVTYLSDDMAIEQLKSNMVGLVIILPCFTKDMIRKFGSQGLLLPHKVTRHVIPSRPLAINVPLGLLANGNISSGKANEKLKELLSAKRADRRPPGSVVGGRRYDEELILFSG